MGICMGTIRKPVRDPESNSPINRYGFQSWIGGECLYVCLLALSPSLESHIPNTLPSSTGTTTAHFLAYILFMLLSLPVLYIRPHNLTRFFHASATIILVFFLVLLIWALATMGPAGFGDTFSSSPSPGTETSLGWLVCYGVISTIGSIAAGILNQNDYARFARAPRDAVLGQLWSFPLYAILCSVAGILVTAATQQRFGGEALWSLPDLLGVVVATGGGRSRAAAFFGGAALVVSQVGVNVPGNALSGGFDFAATFPTYINIRRGAYLTAALSIATNPWLLVNTATTFLSVLSAYAVFLGPMTGCMIASYLLVNRRKLKVEDLYRPDRSVYWYARGVNWRAAAAWAAGTAPSLPGFVASLDASVVVPVGLTRLYYLCFLSGFCIAAAVYAALHAAFPARAVAEWVAGAPPAGVLMRAYRERWDGEEGAEVVDEVGVGGEGEERVAGRGDGGEDGKGGRVAVKGVDGV
ncbi:hypothetical protein SLS56_006032 [Neofusicoccum ribis]|uniref:Uncharacterized protein n=1 Tax=Neofusicoccum ribis TaxID=45134 RepID=A0ABR3SS06_9PEZI